MSTQEDYLSTVTEIRAAGGDETEIVISKLEGLRDGLQLPTATEVCNTAIAELRRLKSTCDLWIKERENL